MTATLCAPPVAVPHKLEVPPLAVGLESPDEIKGDICIATVRSNSLMEVAGWMADVGIDYYAPIRVVRYQDARGRWRERHQPFFAGLGFLFVGGGVTGKSKICGLAEMFRGHFRGFVGNVDHPATQAKLRRELWQSFDLLKSDPTLEAFAEFRRGQKVKVVGGKWAGLVGYVETVEGESIFSVRLTILGASVPLPVPANMLVDWSGN